MIEQPLPQEQDLVLLMLQRRLLHDCARWRTVIRFPPANIGDVTDAARKLQKSASELVEWRIVTGQPPHVVLGHG